MFEWPSPMRSASSRPEPMPCSSKNALQRLAHEQRRQLAGGGLLRRVHYVRCAHRAQILWAGEGHRIDCREPVSNVPPMQIARLLPLALLAVVALATPASAEDKSIAAPDYEFAPKSESIDVGDTITWTFPGPAEHTATSNPGQPEKFDSGLKGVGGTFTHTFTKPGKYQYFCRPHEEFMKGTVTVGKDAVAKSFTSAKVKGAARSIKLTVTLKETAKVTLSVKGTKKKSVSKRLKAGKRTLTVKKLKAGSYKTTVTAQDDFDKKTTKKGSATVG